MIRTNLGHTSFLSERQRGHHLMLQPTQGTRSQSPGGGAPMLTVLCLSRCRPAGPQWLPNTSVCPSHWGLWNQRLQATPELLVRGPGAAGGVRIAWARGGAVLPPRDWPSEPLPGGTGSSFLL